MTIREFFIVHESFAAAAEKVSPFENHLSATLQTLGISEFTNASIISAVLVIPANGAYLVTILAGLTEEGEVVSSSEDSSGSTTMKGAFVTVFLRGSADFS